ncbi:MAG: peptidoglycan DD-metalloendopeptidase family protein [Chitinispirillaceae bacterium]
MKKRTILIVPPRGTRIKAFHIRFSVVVLVFSVVLIGFAGYLIPFNSFTLNVQEQNQKKNLAKQNEKLLQNIVATLRLLNGLEKQVNRLEVKREEVKELAGVPETNFGAAKQKRINPAEMGPSALLFYMNEREKFITRFATAIKQENLFDLIPVCRPVSSDATIVSKRFGPARDPFTGKQKMHYGVDFAGERGTAVVATASGTVSLVENDPIWGRRIVIKHGKGFKTVYAHLGITKVYRGRRVKKGDVIGTVGLSGLTTGPHLHYEVWHKDEAVNPEEYFFPETVLSGVFSESAFED